MRNLPAIDVAARLPGWKLTNTAVRKTSLQSSTNDGWTRGFAIIYLSMASDLFSGRNKKKRLKKAAEIESSGKPSNKIS